jgi:putative transposase
VEFSRNVIRRDSREEIEVQRQSDHRYNKRAAVGEPVPALCREGGFSAAAFYKWRSKYGGMDVSMMARVKELEEENRRLKKMYAASQMDAAILKEALGKKW